MSNIVYFLQRQSDNAIKIGTTKRFNTRLSDLIRQHGDLTLLGVMQGDRDTEQWLLKQFENKRIGQTEFFKPSLRLLRFIKDKTKMSVPTQKQHRYPNRISCTEETRDMLSEFARGSKVTYDELLQFFMAQYMQEVDDPMIAGHKLREQVAKWVENNYEVSDKKKEDEDE